MITTELTVAARPKPKPTCPRCGDHMELVPRCPGPLVIGTRVVCSVHVCLGCGRDVSVHEG